MGKSCVYLPEKGQEVFLKLKQQFGYKDAAFIFNKVRGVDFQEIYKDTLTLTSEGIPTFESIINNPSVIAYLGNNSMLNTMNSKADTYENTIDNSVMLVKKANEFNSNKANKSFIQIVDYADDNKLKLIILPKTKSNLEIANSQYNIYLLNNKIAEILEPLGVTFGDLSSIEISAGRIGLTNFRHAKDVANNFAGLMKVANNMEGNFAKPEEFAHLLVRIFKNKPLVSRSINYLTNKEHAKRVLGKEYSKVYDYYNGDLSKVAEEAVGQLLRDSLVKKVQPKEPLFRRMINYIINLFKTYNPAYIEDTITKIQNNLDKAAEDILSGKEKINKKQIISTYDVAEFNALSERVEAQNDVLRKTVDRLYKNAALQTNLVDTEGTTAKSSMRKFAKRVESSVNKYIKEGESIAAISEVLKLAQSNLTDFVKALKDIDSFSVQNKFILLENVLKTLQAYDPTIKELRDVTTNIYMDDEGVTSQKFMIEDADNSFKAFEGTEITRKDTLEMTPDEIEELIIKDGEPIQLSEDETHYINKDTGRKSLRVTKTIEADKDEIPFDPNSPWSTPATNIGTGVDELVRDLAANKIEEKEEKGKYIYTKNGKTLDKVYPNASEYSLNKFSSQVAKMLAKEEETKKITFTARDVTIEGTVQTIDAAGRTHTVNVAGTLDLLAHDKDGNWYIYDMKTHHGKIDKKKIEHYERQLSLYKKFLEQKYGIKVKGMYIIPIKVTYPPSKSEQYPEGANYTLRNNKPKEYEGVKDNQLLIDGEEFKGADPKLDALIPIKDIKLDLDYGKLSGDASEGLGNTRAALETNLTATSRLYDNLNDLFNSVAKPEFIKVLKQYLGDTVTIKNEKGNLVTVPIEKVLDVKITDSTWAQKWLTSMADNPNVILQAFDDIVKRAKKKRRDKTIDKVQEITALGLEFEKRGIKEYSWMFEDDKARYINHTNIEGEDFSFDRSKYDIAYNTHEKELDTKYGEHPDISTQEFKDKQAERKEWISNNTVTIEYNGRTMNIPSPIKYPSKYSSLTSTQKEFYDKWMELKSELDALLPNNKTFLTNTIKIRKSGIERIKGTLSGKGMHEALQSLRESMTKSFDDDINYETARGLRGFNNEEIMELPIYYINSYGNNEDVSTDVISTLAAYAEMCYNYDSMNEIVHPLEIGKYLVNKYVTIQATKNGRPLYERYKSKNKEERDAIIINTETSNFMGILNQFFESKVYGRKYQDTGNIEIGEGEHKISVDKHKAAGMLLSLGSTVQLGFNVFAGAANLLTNTAMQNIEAASGEFFNKRELAKADSTILKEMPSYMGDIGKRTTFSKLALIDEKFDIKRNFRHDIKNKNFLNRMLLLRVFGPKIQFICQTASDFFGYNRTALAVFNRNKVLYKGNKISLYDAFDAVPINSEHPEYGNKLVLKEGVTTLEGDEITEDFLYRIETTIHEINNRLFGIYDEEDAIAARSTILGRFGLQYRDFIPTAIRYRFGAKTTNTATGHTFEGIYRTFHRVFWDICEELKHGEQTIPQIWDDLEDWEKANIRRALMEVSQWAFVCSLGWFISNWKDKENNPWAKKVLAYTSYMLAREKTELGAVFPVMMPKEMINIMRSPVAATNIISDIHDLGSVLWFPNWFDEIEGGDYRGHSTAYRAFMRSPLTLWYRNIKRLAEPEKAERFYNEN